jgi:hypothetical protein
VKQVPDDESDVPLKRQLTFGGLHNVASQKMELFRIAAPRMSRSHIRIPLREMTSLQDLIQQRKPVMNAMTGLLVAGSHCGIMTVSLPMPLKPNHLVSKYEVSSSGDRDDQR